MANVLTNVANLPNVRYKHGSIVDNNSLIYVIGGLDYNGGQSSDVYTYNIVRNVWSQPASAWLPSPRHSMALVRGTTGIIYSIGGIGITGVDGALLVYDPDNPDLGWDTTKPSVPVNYYESGAAADASGNIYSVCGRDQYGTLQSDVYAYNPFTAVWTQRTSSPVGRAGFATATDITGNIYIIGGYDDTLDTNNNQVMSNRVDIYDPLTDVWTVGPPLPIQLAGHAAITGTNWLIYIIGGYTYDLDNSDNIIYSPSLYAYNSTTFLWTTTTISTISVSNGDNNLSTGIADTALATPADNNIYIIGGKSNVVVGNVTTYGLLKTTPVITWATPPDISYGTTLSNTQLGATTTDLVPGTFIYTPPSGTILKPGPSQVLSTWFTPTNLINYNGATKSVTINVNKATPNITWSPGVTTINYGTQLSNVHLNALLDNDLFTYNPPAGVTLPAGSTTLSATYTPQDLSAHNVVNITNTQVITKVTPNIVWTPANVTHGTAIGASQLGATTTPVIDGSFIYVPPAGTVFGGTGSTTLTTTFTPTDKSNYSIVTRTATLTIT